MLRMIVQYFIRSAWIIEGLANNDQGQPRQSQNLNSLLELTCTLLEASDSPCFHPVHQHSGGVTHLTAIKDDIITMVYFLMRRLTIDNRGPSHPEVYDSIFLENRLISEHFKRIIALPIKGDNVDRYNNSRLKNVFIQTLGTFCYGDPTQIPKMIENGTLQLVVDMAKEYFPVH